MAKSKGGLPSNVGNAVNISTAKPSRTVNSDKPSKIGGPAGCPKLTPVKCPKGKGGK